MLTKTHDRHSGRKVMSISRLTVRTLAKQGKGSNLQGLESMLQYNWSLYLWMCRNVADLKEEADKFEIPMEDETFTYYPDFRMVLVTGEIFYLEIKPMRFAKKDEIQARHNAIKEYMNNKGYQFLVLTEEDLPLNQVGISNLRRLKWFEIARTRELEALRRLLPNSATTFGKLCSQLGNAAIVMEMMATQLLRFDLNSIINDQTFLTISGDDDYVQFTCA